MRLSALSLPDKTPEAKGECMSDRGRPIGLHTYTTRARSGHGSQISLPAFRGGIILYEKRTRTCSYGPVNPVVKHVNSIVRGGESPLTDTTSPTFRSP